MIKKLRFFLDFRPLKQVVFILLLGFSLGFALEDSGKGAQGGKKILWIRCEFPQAKLEDHHEEKICAYMKIIDSYLKRHSQGRTSIADYEMTPIFRPIIQNSDFSDPSQSVDRIAKIMTSMAKKSGYQIKNRLIYLYYAALPPINIGSAGALGTGNGVEGMTWLPSPFYIPGALHESFHMLGVGHAEAVIGKGNEIYPGEATGGLDPYFFMGSEEDATQKMGGEFDWKIAATIPLAMKYYLGWIDSHHIVKMSMKDKKRVKIFIHDTDGSYQGNILGVEWQKNHLTSRFLISYVKNAASRAIKKTGVLLHEIPVDSPAVTRLLDLHPHSIQGNPYRPNNRIYDKVFDLGDAALEAGEEVEIKGQFTLRVNEEGGEGDGRWAEISLNPSSD